SPVEGLITKASLGDCSVIENVKFPWLVVASTVPSNWLLLGFSFIVIVISEIVTVVSFISSVLFEQDMVNPINAHSTILTLFIFYKLITIRKRFVFNLLV